jgi:hypothetical protein
LRALMSEPLTSIKRPGNFAELPPLFIQGWSWPTLNLSLVGTRRFQKLSEFGSSPE